MPSSQSKGYTKVASEPTASGNIDWCSDDSLLLSDRWGGTVSFANGKVDGYKLEAILRSGFFRVRAPAFSDPYVTMQTMAVLFTISIVAMCFTLFHMTGVMHVDGTLVSMAGSAFGYFSGLSSFLFGFFIFDNLATYLTVKNTYLGGFWGSFSDLMMLTACWFPGDDDDNKEFKRSLIRWGLAAFALMCGGAGGEITMDAVIEQVQERNMLTSDEAQIVKRLGGSASVPLMWMFEVFETNIHEKSLLGAEFKVDKIESVVMRMRGSISGVLTAVSSFGLTPLPLVHLMSALVKMQLFLLSIKEGVDIADIMVNDTQGKLPQILFCLLMGVCTPVILQGLLEFIIMIRNPFGEDWIDLPVALYHRDMRTEMFAYIAAAETAAGLPTVKAVKFKK